jgi:hypothetical protein
MGKHHLNIHISLELFEITEYKQTECRHSGIFGPAYTSWNISGKFIGRGVWTARSCIHVSAPPAQSAVTLEQRDRCSYKYLTASSLYSNHTASRENDLTWFRIVRLLLISERKRRYWQRKLLKEASFSYTLITEQQWTRWLGRQADGRMDKHTARQTGGLLLLLLLPPPPPPPPPINGYFRFYSSLITGRKIYFIITICQIAFAHRKSSKVKSSLCKSKCHAMNTYWGKKSTRFNLTQNINVYKLLESIQLPALVVVKSPFRVLT